MASVASSSSFSTRLLLHSPTPLLCRRRRRRSRPNFLRMVTRSCLDDSSALLRAAQYTVDTYVKNGMVVGLGSGHASGMAIQHLGRQLRTGNLKDIVGIPMSVASASEAAKAGIPLDTYQESSQIDFAFDDADVIEEGTLVAIIGRRKLQGEESIIQEKSILNAASKLVFIIEETQYKGGLEGSIPVLIQSLNWMATAEEIDDMFLGDAEVWRRPSIGQAGPLGGDFPLVTREGHNVLDVIFTSPIESLAEVAKSLDKVDGVVDHGVISKIPVVVCALGAPIYLVQGVKCNHGQHLSHLKTSQCQCTVVIASQNGLNILDKLTADIGKNNVTGTVGSFKKKGKGKQDFTKAKIKSGGKVHKPISGSFPSVGGTVKSFVHDGDEGDQIFADAEIESGGNAI
ncbi:ribose-5-phosphate isomerase 4 [Spatholobus suberectus]|nr:ribose-5-phosphate isomerase 4 [Spatholobus suberectus]